MAFPALMAPTFLALVGRKDRPVLRVRKVIPASHLRPARLARTRPHLAPKDRPAPSPVILALKVPSAFPALQG